MIILLRDPREREEKMSKHNNNINLPRVRPTGKLRLQDNAASGKIRVENQ
jgi:hypothetical protein